MRVGMVRDLPVQLAQSREGEAEEMSIHRVWRLLPEDREALIAGPLATRPDEARDGGTYERELRGWTYLTSLATAVLRKEWDPALETLAPGVGPADSEPFVAFDPVNGELRLYVGGRNYLVEYVP